MGVIVSRRPAGLSPGPAADAGVGAAAGWWATSINRTKAEHDLMGYGVVLCLNQDGKRLRVKGQKYIG